MFRECSENIYDLLLNSSRTLNARGIKYVWTPVGDAVHVSLLQLGLEVRELFLSIFKLHPYNLSPTHQLVKIQRQAGTVTLDLTTEAVQAGLLEMTIVATVILQSGRNIE
jgi:hypothetical protein